MSTRRLSLLLLACALAASVLAACGSTKVNQAPPAKENQRKKADAPIADAGAGLEPLPSVEFEESEFGESDRSRDPFRTYEAFFLAETKSAVPTQRTVLLDQYSLNELKLIGIVQRANPAMAMLVDPNGKGHTIKRGQFVGRSEVVTGAAQRGAAYELNWRVERIREGDVVFVREDPANPDVPSATKVIALRPEDSLTSD